MQQAVAFIDCCLPGFCASVELLGLSVPKSDLCRNSAVGLFVNTDVEFIKSTCLVYLHGVFQLYVLKLEWLMTARNSLAQF